MNMKTIVFRDCNNNVVTITEYPDRISISSTDNFIHVRLSNHMIAATDHLLIYKSSAPVAISLIDKTNDTIYRIFTIPAL